MSSDFKMIITASRSGGSWLAHAEIEAIEQPNTAEVIEVLEGVIDIYSEEDE